jgi:hypothetical protein
MSECCRRIGADGADVLAGVRLVGHLQVGEIFKVGNLRMKVEINKTTTNTFNLPIGACLFRNFIQ